jgi:hypothetical protein
MGLANKLFEVVDDEPRYTPLLINLPQFKALYKKDKSETKRVYAQHLAFIWFYCDPRSPYRDSENRLGDSAFAAYGKRNVTITKELQDCIDEYIKRQSTAETRSLDSSLKICDNMIKSLQTNEENNSEYYRLINDIEAKLREEEDIDERFSLAKQKLEIEDAINKKIKESADLIPKLNKLVESLLDLRKKIKTVEQDLDTDTNTERIENYIIYDVISTFKYK